MKNTIEITSWGKSMYGGWYVNYFDNADGDYHGERFSTLTEIILTMDLFKKDLPDYKRFDN